jgi:predicted DNA-binding ribbon-helix-helix protein
MRRRPKRASLLKKRTIVIGEHKTSVSREEAFWRSLKEIAASAGVPITGIVSRIHVERQTANMASAIPIYVPEHYRRLVDERRSVNR